MIYWFTGASTQAVPTGAYRAVEFIKANIKLEGAEKASVEDTKKVVEICTQYAQKGMFNIFLTVFFSTLAFAFLEPFFFIGYLISIALFGLFQAIFMANAGGAWDNAKKIVEVELKEKGTPLHAATVVGDTVGDPFKDTSSVAMNPIIKFTTLFGLLAVELAITLPGHTSVYLCGRFLRDLAVLRAPLVLRDADQVGVARRDPSGGRLLGVGLGDALVARGHGDQDRAHAAALDLLGAEHQVAEADLVALLRNLAEEAEHQAADRVPFRVRQLDAEQLAEIVDGRATLDPVDAVGHRDELGLVRVVLVLDLADQLLEHVLERDQADDRAVLVGDQRRVELLPLHLAQQLRHLLRVRARSARGASPS